MRLPGAGDVQVPDSDDDAVAHELGTIRVSALCQREVDTPVLGNAPAEVPNLNT